jgi:hypothetical protein
MACDVESLLVSLMHPSCMERHTSPASAHGHIPPVYVVHYPLLVPRRRALEDRLLTAGPVPDLTWVLCANREDVDSFSEGVRRCLFQIASREHASKLSNGTRSLALKHLLVYADMRQRSLQRALVFEDDVGLPPSLWKQMSHPSFTVPPDADLFWLGGGKSNYNLGWHTSMASVDAARYCGSALDLKRVSGQPLPRLHKGAPTPQYCVFRRDFAKAPPFIGAFAYIMTLQGAMSWRGWPVRGPADLVLSLESLLCRRASSSARSSASSLSLAHHGRRNATMHSDCHLRQQYSPARWVVAQNHSGFGLSLRSHQISIKQ